MNHRHTIELTLVLRSTVDEAGKNLKQVLPTGLEVEAIGELARTLQATVAFLTPKNPLVEHDTEQVNQQ